MKSERIERTCPVCGKIYTGVPAISRTDNATLICPDCGTRQALESLGISREEQDKILGIIHDKYIPVGVWEVTADDEAKLDLYEGYPAFYYKKEIRLPIEFFDGKGIVERTAFVYIMHEERLLGIPTGYYVRVCATGYHNFGFDVKLLEKAYQKSMKGVSRHEI